MPQATRRSTSMTMDSSLLDDAKQFGINISRAAEAGLIVALKEARADAWKRENSEVIGFWNTFVDEHGVPLSDLRKF